MRGDDKQQLDVFSYVSPEQRVPQDHPLRPIRAMTDEALRELRPRFNKLQGGMGLHLRSRCLQPSAHAESGDSSGVRLRWRYVRGLEKRFAGYQRMHSRLLSESHNRGT